MKEMDAKELGAMLRHERMGDKVFIPRNVA
jgi:hypothetical protein